MVGQIPKLSTADAVEDDVTAGAGGLSQRVVDALKGWQAQLWTPPFLASERSRCQRRLATVIMDVPTIKRASAARQECVGRNHCVLRACGASGQGLTREDMCGVPGT